MPAEAAPLHVEADLELRMTSPGGQSATAWLSGQGRHLAVETDRPDRFLGAVGRSDMGRLADALASAGLTATVLGPRGQVAVLGTQSPSRIGRLITGSSQITPDITASLRLAGSDPRVRKTVVRAAGALTFLALGQVIHRMRSPHCR